MDKSLESSLMISFEIEFDIQKQSAIKFYTNKRLLSIKPEISNNKQMKTWIHCC